MDWTLWLSQIEKNAQPQRLLGELARLSAEKAQAVWEIPKNMKLTDKHLWEEKQKLEAMRVLVEEDPYRNQSLPPGRHLNITR